MEHQNLYVGYWSWYSSNQAMIWVKADIWRLMSDSIWGWTRRPKQKLKYECSKTRSLDHHLTWRRWEATFDDICLDFVSSLHEIRIDSVSILSIRCFIFLFTVMDNGLYGDENTSSTKLFPYHRIVKSVSFLFLPRWTSKKSQNQKCSPSSDACARAVMN